MLFEELIQRFKEERNHAHLHANELLDFIQNKYIHREITIVEYKRLYSELDKLQAEKPKSYRINVFS
ncbi:YppF family protein [Mesobacillus maritimus]|uniref:YppF family protein n=1 Tax=Mesobacillus maritimus TaxID=1643336 RepID=UPI003D8185BD